MLFLFAMEESENKGESSKTSGKHSNKSVNKSQKGFLDSMRDNPWILTSIVLALILIVVVAFGNSIFSGNSAAGGAVSKEEITKKISSFFEKQGMNAKIISIEREGMLYTVKLEAGGQTGDVYTSLDGKMLVLSTIPLDVVASPDTPQQSAPNISKSDKPKVDLFVMSHCPYGIEAQKMMLPVISLLGKSAEIKVRFVPYAMHGKIEIDDNNIEYCIQKDQPEKFNDFLTCFVNSANSSACIKNAKVNETNLNSCMAAIDKQFNITTLYNNRSTWLSGRYPLYPVEEKLAEQYGVQGSENIVINGVSISPSVYRWSTEKMKQIICSSFNNPPAECKQNITSTTTSGGATGAAAGAGCGA